MIVQELELASVDQEAKDVVIYCQSEDDDFEEEFDDFDEDDFDDDFDDDFEEEEEEEFDYGEESFDGEEPKPGENAK